MRTLPAAMYRLLFIVCLCAGAATGAPQEPPRAADSDITYVQIQPMSAAPGDAPAPATHTPYRESRIQNIPLVIPGNTIVTAIETIQNKTISIRNETVTTSDTAVGNITDKPSAEAIGGHFETTTAKRTSEASEPAAAAVDALIQETEEYESRTKPPAAPRFFSKLSYFQKTDDFKQSPSKNLLENGSKRQFRSKCRCERIWNCPKLQITVPRCPNDYFMCCF